MAYFALLLLLAAVSCQKTGVEGERVPMSFGTGTDDVYAFTKADALNDAGQSTMKVWTTRVASEGNTNIMPGYRANYTGSEWSYTSGEGTSSQTWQYWDLGASAFRFHAGAPASAVSAMAENSLTMAMEACSSADGLAYYSTPVAVNNADAAFGQTVQLSFNHAYCKVQLLFKMAETQSGAHTISNISIAPKSGQSYPQTGSLLLSYSWGATPSVSPSFTPGTTSTSGVSFGGVTLAAPGTTASAPSAECWYMLPSNDSGAVWTVSIDLDGSTKTTVIPAGKAVWQPGKSYTYSFEVSPRVLVMTNMETRDWTERGGSSTTIYPD